MALVATTIEVLFHADLHGQLLRPSCRPDAREPPDYAALVATVSRVRAERAAAGTPAPLVLLGGDQLGPGLFARKLLLEDEGLSGARALAALFRRAGYDAIALGNHELAVRPEYLDWFARAVTDAGMPLVATNLRCDPTARDFCKHVRREVIVERGGRRIAVLAALSPRVLESLRADRKAGIALLPPLEALRSSTRRLRAQGVEQVVAMIQLPDRGAAEEVYRLQHALEDGPAPDLLLASGLFDPDGHRTIRLHAHDGAPPVVGSTAASDGVSRVLLPDGPDAPAARALPAEPGDRDGVVAAALDAQRVEYCRRFAVELGKAHRRLEREDLLGYALEVMRRRAGAEIAIGNQGLVRRQPFPLEGAILGGDLERAMPYRAFIGTARLTGAEIEDLLAPALEHPELASVGFVSEDGELRINGRPLDRARSYRVAITQFVAEGGAGILEARRVRWRPLPGPTDVLTEVERFILGGGPALDGDPTIDPDTDFGPPLAERLLVVGMVDLDVNLAETALSNRRRFADPQLDRAESRSVQAELTTRVRLRSPRHEADGQAELRYGYARSKPPEEMPVSDETDDLVTLSATYDYRGLRTLLPDAPAAAVPDPYVRLAMETELTRPDERGWHHLELTNTAGAIWTLFPQLRVRGGTGYRVEPTADVGSDDPTEAAAGRFRLLVEAGALLDPVGLVSVGTQTIRLEGSLDYALVDPARDREHVLKGGARLSLPVLPTLYLSTGADLFAVHRGSLGWGTAYGLTAGIRVHLDAAHQSH